MKDQIKCHVRFMFNTDALLILKNFCNTVSKYSPIYNKLLNEWNTETMKFFIDYLKKKKKLGKVLLLLLHMKRTE